MLYKRMDASDLRELTALLARRLGMDGLALKPLEACVWPVFKGSAVGVPPVFVKVAPLDNVQRTLDFLVSAAACPLIPRALTAEPVVWGDRAVLCTEWRECRRIPAEEMSDAEADALLSGIRTLSAVLASAPNVIPDGGRDCPATQHEIVAAYVRRHPLASRLIAPLANLPRSDWDYGSRALSAIHGDMHVKNYGFSDGALSAVFDYDALVRGLPCEDVTYAFTERMRKSELGAKAKRRLVELFARLVRNSPWPADEWRVAVNHARLRIASRRLAKHPHGVFVALDVERRDRQLRPLLDALP